jgi:hypothetical protein
MSGATDLRRVTNRQKKPGACLRRRGGSRNASVRDGACGPARSTRASLRDKKRRAIAKWGWLVGKGEKPRS